jgi:O-antigen/teichoic acid export membrane protein
MNDRSPMLNGLVYLSASRASIVCMNLVTTSRLAHALGTDNFGLFSFAVSYLSYFMIVVNLGFETFLTREIAFDREKLRPLVDSMISMRLLLGAGSAVLLVASLWLINLSPLGRIVVLIQGINLCSSAIGLTSWRRANSWPALSTWRACYGSFTHLTTLFLPQAYRPARLCC